ncbi:MAG: hypothetical protein PUF65_00255 [Lachnospiraceae bacterium]|nr:hypothetical protein [Lachnospiraceae bacterium]
MPKKSVFASKFQRLDGIYQKLDEQNKAIYEGKQLFKTFEQKLLEVKGTRYLPIIVQGYGYKNVKEFLAEYKASKAEYGDYRKAVTEWEKLTGEKMNDRGAR